MNAYACLQYMSVCLHVSLGICGSHCAMKAVDRAQRQILREKLSGFELFKEWLGAG